MADPPNPYKKLRITLNPDGTLTRSVLFPSVPPTGSESGSDPPESVFSRDVILNATNKTWIRLFLPTAVASGGATVPLIIYFHGGGYILYSAASQPFHMSCSRLARELPAVVASVEYRLAPEHRLPAAFDDAMEAIQWVRAQALDRANGDPWLRDHVDFNQCYLLGSSAGASIAYHAALRIKGSELSPIQIQGFMLNIPYFGGVQRTGSELRLKDDAIVPLTANDLMWELTLPVGAGRDHEFCNPMVSRLDRAADIGWLREKRWLVRGYGGDPLVDRQKEVVEMLKSYGMNVEARFDEDGYHAVELFDSQKAQELFDQITAFVHSSGKAATDSSTSAK